MSIHAAAVASPASPFRICILNAGQYVKAAQLTHFFQSKHLRIDNLEKRPWSHCAFADFPSVEARDAAVKVLTTLEWKGQTLSVKLLTDPERTDDAPLKRKRTESENSHGPPTPTGEADGPALDAASIRDVNDVVTPWRDVPYKVQLARKQELMEDVQRLIALRIRAHVLRKAGIKWLDRHVNKATKRLGEQLDEVPGDAAVLVESTSSMTRTGAASSEPVSARHSLHEAGSDAAAFSEPVHPSSDAPDLAESRLRVWRSDITRNLPADAASRVPPWLVDAAAANHGQACPVLPILPSPDSLGYRNKAVFTVGFDSQGQPCVGSRISSFAEGCIVARPDGAVHLPSAILDLAAAMDDFVKASPLPPYDLVTHAGVWRTVTVRWSATRNETMVIVLFQPPGSEPELTPPIAARAALRPLDALNASPADGTLSIFPEALAKELTRMCELLASPRFRVVSVFAQSYTGLSQPPPNHPHTLIMGRSTITEVLCGMSFNVSPGAFFQVNSGAADVLYRLVRDLALRGASGFPGALPSVSGASCDPDASNLAVLDVCCGTGTIGIICSQRAARVIGVELSEDAIADAVANARLNEVSNAVFVCAKAEDTMSRLLALAQEPPAAALPAKLSDDPASASPQTSTAVGITHVVAILDPPRGGVHMDVVRALRTCKLIKRIVYVSCNPTGSFIDDATRFCAPQEDRSSFARGPAFHIVGSIPCDLFPHTPHTELVTLFERA